MTPYKPVRVLWHWITMGPYHFARMNALAREPNMDITVVEDSSLDDHGWQRTAEAIAFRMITTARFERILGATQPDVIIDGFCDLDAVARVLTHLRHRPETKLILWSETTRWDRRRLWWRESVKRLLLSQFDGALVAGAAHGDYLSQLGVPRERIATAGGCVDNDFFREEACRIRRTGEGRDKVATSRPYFLFVGRLIPAKNVDGLIAAYAAYRRTVQDPWDLVIVGSGPEEPRLREAARSQCPEGIVFAGLRQAAELVCFYAWAGCFVLPSLVEPWGLVTNEAIASGVPVIVSDRCGCAHELVRHGHSGFTFSPKDTASLAGLLKLVATRQVDLVSLAAHAAERLDLFTPRRYAQATAELIRSLASVPSRRSGALGRLALHTAAAAFGLHSSLRASPLAAHPLATKPATKASR